MGQARTNRRRAKQMRSNNSHLSGMGVPRYSKGTSSATRHAKNLRRMAKALRSGRSFGYSK